MRKTIVLVILDGWGIGKENRSNPIHNVQPETFAYLKQNYPVTSLQASGISVGLPWGEVGNSEVGHLTIGSGKVIYQHYPRISISIKDKSFFENEALVSAIRHSKENGTAVNLVGLLSRGNVHAALEHLQALITLAENEGAPNIKLHLFADGKDMPPKTVESLVAQLPEQYLATLTGRYYAMDREENWPLTEQTYNCLVGGAGRRVAIATQKKNTATEEQKNEVTEKPNDKQGGAGNVPTLEETLQQNYNRDLTEEFLPPLRFGGEEKNIQSNESIIFFNFREDSIRQLASAFVEDDFSEFERNTPPENTHIATMTRYKEAWNTPVAFPPQKIKNTLGKVLADAGKSQLRVAETYKYAHVTYFFNGYAEAPFPGEQRVLIPSDPIPHPDERPQMRASAITDRVAQAISDRAYDFILVNYANADTIAHSGNYPAAEEAVRVIDAEIAKLLKVSENEQTTLLITADHGNIEEMLDPQTGRIETQHDPSPVPFYVVDQAYRGQKFINYQSLANQTAGILSDIAPTILEMMGLEVPDEMDGKSLLRNLL